MKAMEMMNINGKIETVYQPRDFENLVDCYMGPEAASYFFRYQEDADKKVEAAIKGEETDLRNYEMELESDADAFREIRDELEQALYLIGRPRTDKKKLAALIKRIYKIADNQL